MVAVAPSLKARALRHLARREHTRAELERKLAVHLPKHGANDEGDESEPAQDRAALARALDELAASGLLSDERAAESLLASQSRRFGTRRLKHTLLAKGLAPDLVANTLQRSRATEHERALDIWRRRFGGIPANATERARQMRFLAGRGFDAEVIRRVVKGEAEG